MPLDFPSNPVNGQVYENYYWDSVNGVWNSLGNYAIPNILSNGTFTAASSTTVPLTVSGTSGQSVNLQEWKNSSGTTLASMSASGGLTLNNALAVGSGGTGVTSLASGTYLKGNGTNAIQTQAGIPATDITSGSLAIAYGGTGATTGAGGVPMVASSVGVNAGSASVNAAGVVTFSGVTNLGLNGIFNSNYEHYRVVVTNYAASSAGANQSVQLRKAGTTLTSATYQWYGYRFVSWSNAAIAGNGAGSWYMMESNSQSSAYYTSVMDFISPFNVSEYTRYVNTSYLYGTYYGTGISNGMIGTADSYDGLTLNFTAASSGSVRVYGYK